MNTMLSEIRIGNIALVEAAIGAGGRDPGCRDGARAFWLGAALDALCEGARRFDWHPMPRIVTMSDREPLPAIARATAHLAGTTERLTAAGRRFVVLGGDHSCAVGTWSGVARALRPMGALGLVWIDAHMDMHVPETSHSGFIHGMPLAALLGRGAAELTGLAGDTPAIDPRHVCLVGIRSFEPEEMALAERLGVRVIQMDEVRRRGVRVSLAEAHAIASAGTAGYGVSLDLDGLDPRDAPAVATPEPGGIRASDLQARWSELTADARCLGAEIVEYNPYHDGARVTERTIQRLLARAFEHEAT